MAPLMSLYPIIAHSGSNLGFFFSRLQIKLSKLAQICSVLGLFGRLLNKIANKFPILINKVVSENIK